MPDSLVSIVRSQLAKYHLPADYVVQVVESSSQDIVYGFAIGPDPGRYLFPAKEECSPAVTIPYRLTFSNVDVSTRSAK